MTSGFVPRPPPDDRCSFNFNNGQIDHRPLSDGGADRFNEGYFDLVCGGGGHGQFDVVAAALGDPRSWSAGTFQLAAQPNTVGTDYQGGASSIASGCTTANLAGLVLTITVETAVGGAAPFPKVVTDDYLRTFRVDFDTATATPTTSAGPCDFAVTTRASLHFAQTAADYVLNPKALCLCE
jgi:hypothetical protein